MKYFGLTFSDEKHIKTRQRYVDEMKSKNIFFKVFSCGPEDLDEDFLERHKEFILKNLRGYGYWIWKPYIILKVLQQMEDGDILVYGDAGNEMIGTTKECLEKFNMVKHVKHETKIIAGRTHRMFRYVKTDVYFRVKWYALFYAYKEMIESGRIVIEKNEKTLHFVKEWLDLCQNDYRNINDSPSRLPNYFNFVEHRHDQSVLSILFHMYKCEIVDFDDVWPASRLKY